MLAAVLLFSPALIAQQSVTVSGTVKNNKTQETVSAVSVTIKGTSAGSFTDDKGNYKITTVQKLPFTLVFSSVGYTNKEMQVTSNGQVVNVDFEPMYTVGQEIVVSASRVPERIMESPVSIERISGMALRQAPAPTYYEILANTKGVDMMTSSLTFRTLTTRGFNGAGNLRFNQFMDGMDNQAPGLNFSVGSIVGITDLDVESVELLPGASSALYGPGGMNGTLLVSSKSPFKHQGLSFEIKQGIMHVDHKQRPASPMYDWTVRWGKKVSDKFAFKIGAQLLQAQDWLASNPVNYSRPGAASSSILGQVVGGDRSSDPNYDGVNVYGDETTFPLGAIAGRIRTSLFNNFASSPAGVAGTTTFFNIHDNWLNSNPNATFTQYRSFLTTGFVGPLAPLAPLAAGLAGSGFAPVTFGSHSARGFFNGQNVSRAGYNESQVVDPTAVNFKGSLGLYYKLNDKVEASLIGNWGTGNTVYTAEGRYAIQGFQMGQYKLEFKAKDWYLRAYTTQENSGSTFTVTPATQLYNESLKPTTTWAPEYTVAFATARAQGAPNALAHSGARAFADQGVSYPRGNVYNTAAFQRIINTPISKGGAGIQERSDLYAIEGQYNLSKAFGVKNDKFDVLVGGNWRQYVLNSGGNLFADTAGNIKINELGAYAQLSQKLLNAKLKISLTGRYDKNQNFAGRFTPRFTAVYTIVKDHNIRASYQQAYRFPSTQNQWINLSVGDAFTGGKARLIGGLPEFRNYFKFNTNPVYTHNSFLQFVATTSPAALQQQQIGEFKPEVATSYEVGYKGIFFKKLLVDAYLYQSNYTNFLSGTRVWQSSDGTPAGLATANEFRFNVNAPDPVKAWGAGASIQWLLPKNFSINSNSFTDRISSLPTGYIANFNTPLWRHNFGISNTGFLDKNRIGFSVVYHWQQSFMWESNFAAGRVPKYETVDAVITYKLPKTKSMLKVGGTNIFNKYYIAGFGNPQVGGLYYMSFAYNVL